MWKKFMKMDQKVEKYFRAHDRYNAVVHTVTGIGIGILITYPLIGPHPVRWATLLIGIGILGHLYPLLMGK